jgi:hypothetical protein
MVKINQSMFRPIFVKVSSGLQICSLISPLIGSVLFVSIAGNIRHHEECREYLKYYIALTGWAL